MFFDEGCFKGPVWGLQGKTYNEAILVNVGMNLKIVE